jgi:hypothetical protein
MVFYKIDIDEEVWQFLKKNAEPFKDTPNSVLRKLLFRRNDKGHVVHEIKTYTEADFPAFPHRIPQALAQTLEVIYGVRKLGMSRTQATNFAAQKRKVAPQTIIDKYCRQLNKHAYEIDRLLAPQNLGELQSLLEKKFDRHKDVIRDFLKSVGE